MGTLYDASGHFQIEPFDGKMPASTFIAANGVTLNAGTSSDAVGDLQTMLDGNTYHITEAAATPGQDLEVDFAAVPRLAGIVVRAYYEGGATHSLRVQLYNYDGTSWDTFGTLGSGLDYQKVTFSIPDDTNYISSSAAAIVRFYHTEAGNASHDSYIDYCGLIY